MVVEATPGAPLEMSQAQFFFHLLIALLDRPALFQSRTARSLGVSGGRSLKAYFSLPSACRSINSQIGSRRRIRPWPSHCPARPAARRSGPTASPWSPPHVTFRRRVLGPAPPGSPVELCPASRGGVAAGRRRRGLPGDSHSGSSAKTTISSVTPTMYFRRARPTPCGTPPRPRSRRRPGRATRAALHGAPCRQLQGDRPFGLGWANRSCTPASSNRSLSSIQQSGKKSLMASG